MRGENDLKENPSHWLQPGEPKPGQVQGERWASSPMPALLGGCCRGHWERSVIEHLDSVAGGSVLVHDVFCRYRSGMSGKTVFLVQTMAPRPDKTETLLRTVPLVWAQWHLLDSTTELPCIGQWPVGHLHPDVLQILNYFINAQLISLQQPCSFLRIHPFSLTIPNPAIHLN